MSAGNFVAQTAPMAHVARIVMQEQEAPQIKQQALQQVITQHLSKDNEQVERTAASVAGQRVRRRKPGQDRQPGQGQEFEEQFSEELEKQRAGLRPHENESLETAGTQNAESPDAGGATSNVWAGNIVNVKV